MLLMTRSIFILAVCTKLRTIYFYAMNSVCNKITLKGVDVINCNDVISGLAFM
jgi:hypothetical protein